MFYQERTRKFESVKDIPLPWIETFITAGIPLDTAIERDIPEKGIQNLVRVLTGLGWTTTMSCEGHLNPPNSNLRSRQWQYPWVSIDELRKGNPVTSQKYRKINEELTQYNSTHAVHWRTFNNTHYHSHRFLSGLRTIKEANNEQELLTLQKGVDDLTYYLFIKYLRAPHNPAGPRPGA